MTLFISYGMTRSGSTLAFETEKAILEKYGMPQEKIIITIQKFTLSRKQLMRLFQY